MPFDCTTCGACCREAFDAVEISEDDPFVELHPELVIRTPFDKLGVLRQGPRCACLSGDDATPYTCAVYAVRPQTCRDVAVGGEACLWARERVGLPTTLP